MTVEYGVQLRGGIIAPAATAAYAIGYGHRPVAARNPGGDWRTLTTREITAVRAATIPDCDKPGHTAIDRHQRAGGALCTACCDWHRSYQARRSQTRYPGPPLVAAYTWDWPRINAATAGVLR